jgi:ESS family glutamate:Na+ symporter
MTLMQLQYDMMLFAVLLLAGFAAREVCKPLQKLFLPASVIGGTIGLILGQQVLGWIEIPKTFSQFP